MPAIFVCAAIRPNNGIRQVHLTLADEQPNHAYFNVSSSVLRDIFNTDVREGDTWEIRAALVSRAGTTDGNALRRKGERQ